MSKIAVAALALLESVQAFQAPVAPRAASKALSMFEEGDIGTLPPQPLSTCPCLLRRYARLLADQRVCPGNLRQHHNAPPFPISTLSATPSHLTELSSAS